MVESENSIRCLDHLLRLNITQGSAHEEDHDPARSPDSDNTSQSQRWPGHIFRQ